MHIVEHLLDTAYQDSQLLINIASQNDNADTLRDVDFCLATTDSKQAETVCSFINDNRYGTARVEHNEDGSRIIVVAHIPLYQNIINSMSANFVSLAHIFSVEYLGWGCCTMKDE